MNQMVDGKVKPNFVEHAAWLLVAENSFEWEDRVRKVCFAYNISVQACTDY